MPLVYVTGMATHRHPGTRHSLRLKEHRKAKGIRAASMAKALGIERESVYRLEKHPERSNGEQQAIYARECGVHPGDLWEMPKDTVRAAKLTPDGIENLTEADLERLAEKISRRIARRSNRLTP